MKTKLAVALAAFTLGVPGVALAAQYPTVDFNSWTVRTLDGKKHTGIAPHTTFKHCKSNPATRVTAVGDYKKATVGQTFRTSWYLNSSLVSTSVYSWKKTHGTSRWSLFKKSGNPIPDGRYDLLLTHNGHTFAESWLKLGTKKKHGKPC